MSALDRRSLIFLAGGLLVPARVGGIDMPTVATIARIWRGRTRREDADAYEPYLSAEGVAVLEKMALGVQLFREDRELESWFVVVSYWADIPSMTAFTGGDPTEVHHLPLDQKFLIELPARIEIHRIVHNTLKLG